MDLTQTILRAAGVDAKDARLEGLDLLPLLTGETPAVERTLYWRVVINSRQQRAVRSGNWKVLVDGPQQMLFDLEQDPAERHDRAAEHPELLRRLKAEIESWEKDVDAEAALGKP